MDVRGKRSVSTLLARMCVLCCAVSMTLIPLAAVRAIGITPPEVSALNILRNTTQLKSITLSKDPNQIAEAYSFTTEVRSDYAGVIEIEPTVEIPAGRQSATVPFTINTKNLSNGNYSVVILFYQQPNIPDQSGGEDGTVGAQVGVVSGIAAKVTFSVGGDEHVEYAIRNLHASTTETDDPVTVGFAIDNTGNVVWRPQKIEFIFADQHNSENTITITVDAADIPVSDPGAEKTVDLDLTPVLTAGTYTVTGIFFDHDSEVERLESQPFEVFPPNTLSQSGELSTLTTNKTSYQPGENIKLEAEFMNTGEIRVSGTLMTEIYKDAELIDERTGEELDSDAGETSSFSEVFALNSPGTYTLTTYVTYGHKKSAKKSIDIHVVDPGAVSSARMTPFIIIGVVCCAILCTAVVIKRKRWHTASAQQIGKRTPKKR